MRKVFIAIAFAFSGTAFAHEHEGHSGKSHGHGGHGGHGHHGGMKECQPLKEACQKAGFSKGGHKEGKGLIVDCMGKFAKGEKVEGVALDPADPSMKACIDQMAMKKDRMMERMEKRKAKKAAKESL